MVAALDHRLVASAFGSERHARRNIDTTSDMAAAGACTDDRNGVRHLPFRILARRRMDNVSARRDLHHARQRLLRRLCRKAVVAVTFGWINIQINRNGNRSNLRFASIRLVRNCVRPCRLGCQVRDATNHIAKYRTILRRARNRHRVARLLPADRRRDCHGINRGTARRCHIDNCYRHLIRAGNRRRIVPENDWLRIHVTNGKTRKEHGRGAAKAKRPRIAEGTIIAIRPVGKMVVDGLEWLNIHHSISILLAVNRNTPVCSRIG